MKYVKTAALLVISISFCCLPRSALSQEEGGAVPFEKQRTELIQNRKPSVVQVKAEINWSALPEFPAAVNQMQDAFSSEIESLEEERENLEGDDSNGQAAQIEARINQLEQYGEVLRQIFGEEYRDRLDDSHRRAFRKLYGYMEGVDQYSQFLERLSQMNINPTFRVSYNDVLDFLQYVEPSDQFSGAVIGDQHVLTARSSLSMEHISRVHVILSDGTRLVANPLGYSSQLDVQVLEVPELINNRDAYEPLEMEPVQEQLRMGGFLTIVGAGPREAGYNASHGIVSATERMQGRAFQTDALVNYTTNGGAVFGLDGGFLGIVTGMSLSNAFEVGINSGITQVISTDGVLDILDQLKQGARIQEPFLGIQADRGASEQGVRISRVLDDTAADEAGLQPGDVIVSFGGTSIEEWRDVVNQIQVRLPGDRVQVEFLREGERQTVQVTLISREDA